MSQYINLSSISTLPTTKIGKAKANDRIDQLIKKLAEIQDKLYAQKNTLY